MSFMLEVLYRMPPHTEREQRIATAVKDFGGKLTFREVPEQADLSQAICLTFEFETFNKADICAAFLRKCGEFVDGPTDYGPAKKHLRPSNRNDDVPPFPTPPEGKK